MLCWSHSKWFEVRFEPPSQQSIHLVKNNYLSKYCQYDYFTAFGWVRASLISNIKHMWYLGLHVGLPPNETVIFNEKSRPITSAADVACFYKYKHGILLSARISHIFFFCFFVFQLQKQSKPGQPADDVHPPFVFVLKSRLIVQLSARSRVCGIATLEPILQTTGVWSGVLDKSFSLCVQRITLFRKNWLQVLFWLWSPMFLWLDYCQACGQFTPRLCKKRGIFSSLNVTFDDFWFYPVKQCVIKMRISFAVMTSENGQELVKMSLGM